MNFCSRFWKTSGSFRFTWIVSILIRLYKSGNWQKLFHTTGSDCSLCSISLSMVKPSGDISGRTARPASLISPNRSILRHLSLFSSDQLLRSLRGQSFWAVTLSAIFFVVLSIQPKHRASSTASIYQKVVSSVGLPRLTTTQHSFSVLWFCISHSRSSTLDLISRRLCISIAT